MFRRASDRCGSPPKFSQHGSSTVKTGLCGFGLGFGFGLVGGGGGGGGAGVTVTPLSCVSSLPEGWSGLRIRYADASPAARRAATAAATMIRVRVLGRRGTRKQCASLSRRSCTGAVALGLVAAALLAPAAPARGPATTDEPGSLVAAFAQRSYAPGQHAELQLWTAVPHVTGQFFRAGPERLRSPRDDVLGGVPVGPAFRARGRAHASASPSRAGPAACTSCR